MPTLDLWLWRVRDHTGRRRVITRYRMTEAEALASDPTAERVPHSLEQRHVPGGERITKANTPPQPGGPGGGGAGGGL